MSRPWRLRHKLGLGLLLVVASVGLLLCGTVFGMASYLDARRTTDRKIDEMQVVTLLRDHIHQIAAVRPEADPANATKSTREAQAEQIQKAVALGRETLGVYRDHLAVVADPEELDRSEAERSLLLNIEAEFDALDAALRQAMTPGVGNNSSVLLVDDPAVRRAYTRLDTHSMTLFSQLVSDVKGTFERTNAHHRRSEIIAGSASALAVVLVLTLLYYFRVWVFTPIRQLQAGVKRVHGGDFDHPITLDSQDELAELAGEFNAMTARLREVYANLAQQVNDRTRQLVRSERLVSVGFLAAGVAHEINNPLASIAFCSEALERRLSDLLATHPGEADVIHKYLSMMQQEAFRCKQITHKLLDFSRTGGRREATDIGQLVSDVLDMAGHLPNGRGKTVVFDPPSGVVAPVNAPDIKSVVLNLVVNALDSMDDGGTLRVALTTQGEYAEMTFADTGCGMAPDVLENLFEPFFTRSRTGNGTGLGLSISHQIVDQHGGSISASSRGPGQGSTFTVRLPLRAADPTPAADGPILAFPGRPAAAA